MTAAKTVRGKQYGVPRGRQYVRGWVNPYSQVHLRIARREEQERPNIEHLYYGDMGVETPEQFILRQEEASLLRRAIGRLSPRYAKVVCCRYGIGVEPMTLEEVAQKYGLTRERIRQMQGKAERTMLRHLKTDFVERYRDLRRRHEAKYEARMEVYEAKLASVQAAPPVQYVEHSRNRRRSEYMQFPKPACDDPTNRYCTFYTPRVTNAATGEWEWVKYEPSTT